MKKTLLPLTIVIILLAAVGGALIVTSQKNKMQESSLQPTPTQSVSEEPLGSGTTMNPSALAKEITLSISSPANGATVKTATVAVKGKTIAKADIFINEAETTADASGNFSKTITLDEGDNIIVVVANDANGNVAEQELIVNYDPGQ